MFINLCNKIWWLTLCKLPVFPFLHLLTWHYSLSLFTLLLIHSSCIRFESLVRFSEFSEARFYICLILFLLFDLSEFALSLFSIVLLLNLVVILRWPNILPWHCLRIYLLKCSFLLLLCLQSKERWIVILFYLYKLL